MGAIRQGGTVAGASEKYADASKRAAADLRLYPRLLTIGPKDSFQPLNDLTLGSTHPACVNEQRHEVGVAHCSTLKCRQGGLNRPIISPRPQLF